MRRLQSASARNSVNLVTPRKPTCELSATFQAELNPDCFGVPCNRVQCSGLIDLERPEQLGCPIAIPRLLRFPLLQRPTTSAPSVPAHQSCQHLPCAPVEIPQRARIPIELLS